MPTQPDTSPAYDQVGRIRFPNGVEIPVVVADLQPDGTFLPLSILKGIPMRADDPNNTKIELVLNIKGGTIDVLPFELTGVGRFSRG